MANPETPDLTGSKSNSWGNILVAIAALCLGALLFFSTRQSQSQVSLAALSQQSTPYEQAIANPKPTLIEFYADWCTSCQSMAADNLALQNQYRDRLNFVMLNVDNSKWLPEMDRFEVDGIPHFVYLDEQNQVLGNAIGVIPRQVLASNLDAMITHQPLPHLESNPRISTLPASRPSPPVQPTSHGNPL